MSESLIIDCDVNVVTYNELEFARRSMSTEPLLEWFGKAREDKFVSRACEEHENSSHITEIEEDEFQSSHQTEIQKESAVPSSWLINRWVRTKIVDPLLVIIRRGLGPKQLSISAAMGITLGVFPVCGMAVLLCTIAATLLRSNCHLPTLMLANLVSTPLQIGLIVPFLRLGEWASGGQHFSFTPNALWMAINGQASHAIIYGLVHALMGWAIMAPLLLGGFYVIFLPLFWWLIGRFGADQLV
eukprot:Gb_16978 [translate_table: standard]